MIPELEFRFSRVYDNRYRNAPNILSQLQKEGLEYPSEKEIVECIEKTRKEWSKIGKSILKMISEETKLNWNEKHIICYFVGRARGFSDPLTIRIFEKIDQVIDLLTHELIHRIYIGNREKYLKWDKYLLKEYPSETEVTRNHIIVHALHNKIILKLFDDLRLSEEIKNTTNPEYIKAWEIVKKEGYENIINKFREITK